MQSQFFNKRHIIITRNTQSSIAEIFYNIIQCIRNSSDNNESIRALFN